MKRIPFSLQNHCPGSSIHSDKNPEGKRYNRSKHKITDNKLEAYFIPSPPHHHALVAAGSWPRHHYQTFNIIYSACVSFLQASSTNYVHTQGSPGISEITWDRFFFKSCPGHLQEHCVFVYALCHITTTVFCIWDWNPNLTKSCLFL